MNFQVKEDMRVKEKYKKKSKATARKHAPFFGPKPLVKGRPLTPVEVLDFRDSRFLNPPEELRMNKILPWYPDLIIASQFKITSFFNSQLRLIKLSVLTN